MLNNLDTKMKKTSILLVDDHDILRQGLRALLEREPTIEVVGEASTGREAVEWVRQNVPDIVIMDLSMPDVNGFVATRYIHRAHKTVKIIILSMWDDEEYVLQAVDAGARAYLVKKNAAAYILTAIKQVVEGGIFFSPQVADVLLDKHKDMSEDENRLSSREKQVLQLIAEGKSNREITTVLPISMKTVEKHCAEIMKKLDIHERAKLVCYAYEKHIIKAE